MIAVGFGRSILEKDWIAYSHFISILATGITRMEANYQFIYSTLPNTFDHCH